MQGISVQHVLPSDCGGILQEQMIGMHVEHGDEKHMQLQI